MNLKSKIVLVTGGASGLGRATAEALSNRDARVILLDQDARVARLAASLSGPDAIGSEVRLPSRPTSKPQSILRSTAGPGWTSWSMPPEWRRLGAYS
jgi:NAD(P)-dependent dehydrogenase (short-subunit alcohol dehydrogenase family)